LRLKKLREAQEMSQYTLAKKTRISREYLRKVESGGSEPTIRMLQRPADALRVPLVDLITRRYGWLFEDLLDAPVLRTR
jgi:transcriptional regulator with XRE-family HTH domain